MKTINKIAAISVLLLALLFCISLYLPLPKEKFSPAPVTSLRIEDRNGTLLREVLSDEEGRCLWVELKDISSHLLNATLVAEDKDFLFHSGINYLSILRAAAQNIKQGRIVSGASTISQQLVRNIYHFRRNFFSKLAEAWLALRLERTLTKDKILIQYLNRIYYGNQAYGIEAASRLYLDKPAKDLSLAEAAYLAGLPRSPSILNPFHSLSQGFKRQREILLQMYRLGFITSAEQDRAMNEHLSLCSEKEKFRAPHICDYILHQIPLPERRALSVIQTTCDYTVQNKVEILVKNHTNSLEKKGISNAAAVVMDNVRGEIICMVGSSDFFDSRHDGQVNGAISLRQPGSTLKPFTYGLALEKGMTAADIIEDEEIQFPTPEGSYRPRNYDKRYHGPVRLRKALACSYNVPAVSVLQRLGFDLLYQRLRDLGFKSLKKSPSHYGIGLTLGNGEVTLLELVRAYSTLARGGILCSERFILSVDIKDKNRRPVKGRPKTQRILSSQISYILTHILSDKDARIPAFGYNSPLNLPFPCAVKTGTTKDYKDNWTIGYTPKYTVGIWVGNFDGKPMQNVSGVTGSGPLFKDIMLLLEKKNPGEEFEECENLSRISICPLSGKLATASCPGSIEEIFILGTEPLQHCELHQKRKNVQTEPELFISEENQQVKWLKIAFPSNGDLFKIDPILREEYQIIKFRASVPEEWKVDFLEWWINGKKIDVSSSSFSFPWKLKPGFFIIKLLAKKGKKKIESLPVKFRVLS